MKDLSYCPHCYPLKENHLPKKWGSVVDFYFSDPLAYILALFFPRNFLRNIKKTLKNAILNFSIAIGHIKLTSELDRTRVDNATLVLWDEAHRRGLKIFNLKFKGGHTGHFAVILAWKKYYFDTNPIFIVADQANHYKSASIYDDKDALKKVLIKHQLPCPLGRSFVSSKKALAYGVALGFPLIVKPSFSSLSCHVSFNIKSAEELKKAIAIAKQINYKIIVEQYIAGDVHRAVVINNTLEACVKRQAGSIVGDGKSTVDQLIDRRNNHPYRGEPGQKNTTLFKIKKTPQLVKFLSAQRVQLNTRLEKGQRIFLSHKMNVGNSGDVTDVTTIVHPENKILLYKVHRILNIPLSGLDFICKEISQPWHQQPFAIIENNSLPRLDLHHYPSEGASINIAGKVWDFVLDSVRDSVGKIKD